MFIDLDMIDPVISMAEKGLAEFLVEKVDVESKGITGVFARYDDIEKNVTSILSTIS